MLPALLRARLRTTVLVAALLLAAGCAGPSNTDASVPTTTLAPAEQESNVTVEQLAREFMADEVAAEARYKDQWLVVEGVYNSSSETLGTYFLSLKRYEDPQTNQTFFVGCSVDANQWPRVDRLTVGQPITFKARFKSGSALSVDLAECQVLQVGLDPAVLVTAVQLSAEYAVDPRAARAKYLGKQLQVEGVVAVNKPKDLGNVFLAGSDTTADKPVRIRVWFGPKRKERAGPLKLGDSIKVKGQWSSSRSGPDFLDDSKLVN